MGAFPVNAAAKPRVLQLRSQLFQLAVLIAVDRHQALLVETHTPRSAGWREFRLSRVRDRHMHKPATQPPVVTEQPPWLSERPASSCGRRTQQDRGGGLQGLSVSIAEGEPKIWTGWNVCAIVESQTTNRDVGAD